MSDPVTPDRRSLLLAGLVSSSVAVALAGSSKAATSEAGLTVIAKIVAKPESAAEARTALEALATRTKDEAGCLHYALYEEAGAPGRFFTFELWTDEAALNAHLTSPAVKAAGPRFAPLMAAPPAIHKLRALVT